MKKIYLVFAFIIGIAAATSAQLDSITGVTLTFTPDAGPSITATATDSGSGLVADGPILLSESSDYSLSITLQSGSDDITMLIADDPDNYQFFYEPSHDIISGEVEAQDMDSEGLPVGLENELTTECTDDGDPTGTWRVILADLTGIKTASSTSDDGTSLLDVSWTITIEEDAAAPPCENEEEIITDVVLTWTPDDGGAAVEARAQDPDGEGPLGLEILDEVELLESTEYTMTITLTNSIEGEDITEEIMEEDDEHMFFFSFDADIFSDPTGDGNIDDRPDPINYNDVDENGLPVGLSTTWTTVSGTAQGDFRVVLKHQPDIKSATSTSEDGGTDVDLIWTVNTGTVSVDNSLTSDLSNQLDLSPNPVVDALTWSLDLDALDGPTHVHILSSTGQLLQSHTSATSSIDVSSLPSGAYILQLTDGRISAVKRFVKL